MNDIALPADAGRAILFSGNEQGTESGQEAAQIPPNQEIDDGNVLGTALSAA